MTLPAWFEDAARQYEVAARGTSFSLGSGGLRPCLDDLNAPAATIDPHYFHADLWAAELVYRNDRFRNDNMGAGYAPHVDVGSRLDGFVTHLLAQGERVEVVDIRPAPVVVDGLTYRRDDMTTLATFADNSVESLSCLHAAEHVGLFRYSPGIDVDGHAKAMRSLARVLARGGHLYFAVPIGRERVEFNAHRILHPATVIETFERAGLRLESFAAIDDEGAFHPDASPSAFAASRYACGCFELVKP
jgi:SAM-dependent methyltransferase